MDFLRSKFSESETIKRYALYGTLGILFFIYGGAAFMKVIGESEMAARLNELNFGGGWRYFIGVAELIGAPAIFIPKLRRLALLCLWPFAVAGLALHMSYGHERLYPGIVASVLVPISLWLDGGLVFRRN